MGPTLARFSLFLPLLHFQPVEDHLFDQALAEVLGVCRAAADKNLPIEEMLAHVGEASVSGLGEAELDALGEIIAAVGDVAAIGSRLPAPVEAPQPIRVPAAPPGGPSLILFAD